MGNEHNTDAETPQVKKSSIRIYRDMLEHKFDPAMADLHGRCDRLVKDFGARIQTHHREIRELSVIKVSDYALTGSNLGDTISIHLPRSAWDSFTPALKQEIKMANEAQWRLRLLQTEIHQARQQAGVFGDRPDIVRNLLKTRPEGVRLLQQVEELALSIAEDALKER